MKKKHEICVNGQQRERKLKGYIISTYRDFLDKNIILKKKKVENFIFLAYVSFLVEIEKSKMMSYVEMIRLKNYLNLSYLEQAYLNQLYQKASDNFSAQVHNQVKGRIDSGVDIALNKKEYKDLLSGILFDEYINKIESKYFKALKIKEEFLFLLSHDFINLIDIKEKGYELMKEKNELKDDLIQIIQINKSDHKLQIYVESYALHFGFGESKKNLFYRKPEKQLERQQVMKLDPHIFDKDCCVIFITLTNKIGTIKRVQNKFQTIFGFSLADTIGNNVNIIIPKLISKYHDLILQNYVEKGSSIQKLYLTSRDNRQFVSSNSSTLNSLVIARNAKNWALPLSIYLKPENVGISDCGVAGMVKFVHKEYLYAMTSCKYFKVECISQLLFEKILSKYIPIEDITNVYLNRIIPILHYFELKWINKATNQEDIHKDVVKTVAFFPKSENSLASCQIQGIKKTETKPIFCKLEYSSLQKQLKKYSIEYFDIYSLKMKFYNSSNSFNSFNIIEIQQLRKITSPEIQRQNLQLLKKQLKTLLSVNYDISQDLKILKKIDQLAHFQQVCSSELGIGNLMEETLQTLSQDSEEGTPKNDHISPIITNYNNVEQKKANTLVNKKERKQNVLDPGIEIRLLQTEEQLVYENKQIENSRYKLIENHYCDIDNRVPNQTIRQEEFEGVNQKWSSFLIQNDAVNHNYSTFLDSTRIELIEGHQSAQRIEIDKIECQQPYSQVDFPTLKVQEAKDNIENVNNEPPFDHEHLTVQESKKGIFWLLKQKLHEIKMQKMVKSIKKKQQDSQEEESATEIQKEKTQKNQKNQKKSKLHSIYEKKSSTKESKSVFSSLRSNFLNPVISKDDEQLDIFLRQYQEQNSSENDLKIDKDQNYRSIKRTLNQQQLEDDDNNVGIFDGEATFLENSSDLISDNQNDIEVIKLSRMSSSIQTAKTNNQEQKKAMKKMIFQKKKDSYLIFLNLFGLLSILSVALLTFIEYFQSLYMLQDVKQHFGNIPWPNSIRASFSLPISYSALQIMLDNNVFDNNSLYTEDIRNQLTSKIQSEFSTFTNLLKYFNHNGVQGKQYFEFINQYTVPLIYTNDDNVVPTAAKYANTPKYKTTIYLKLQSFMQIMISAVFQNYKSGDKDLQSQKIFLDNFATFSSNLTSTQSMVIQQSQDTLDLIKSNSIIQLELVLSATFLLILMLFPLYFFAQYKNQEVLKLLATLTPLTLSQMLRDIETAIYYQSASEKPMRKLINKRINQQKKRNIASTSQIPKFKLSLFLVGFIVFLMVIIQPITTCILIFQYEQEAQANSKLLGNLYNLIVQTSSTKVVTFQYLRYLLYKGDTTYNPPYYLRRSTSLATTNPQVLANITQVIDQSQNTAYRQQSVYNNFLYRLLNSDICSALQEYPEYISPTYNLNVSKCSVISKGIMKQGFQIAMKQLFSEFTTLTEIFNTQNLNRSQLIDLLKKWEHNLNIIDLEQFIQFMISVMLIQKDFILEMMNSDLDYINKIQLYLMIAQIIQLLVLLSIAWLKFYDYVSREMIRVRRSLTLISVEAVFENPYILSYLKN